MYARAKLIKSFTDWLEAMASQEFFKLYMKQQNGNTSASFEIMFTWVGETDASVRLNDVRRQVHCAIDSMRKYSVSVSTHETLSDSAYHVTVTFEFDNSVLRRDVRQTVLAFSSHKRSLQELVDRASSLKDELKQAMEFAPQTFVKDRILTITKQLNNVISSSDELMSSIEDLDSDCV